MKYWDAEELWGRRESGSHFPAWLKFSCEFAALRLPREQLAVVIVRNHSQWQREVTG